MSRHMAPKRSPPKRSSIKRNILIGLALAGGVLLAAFAVYLVHLDREVQQLYAGVKWVLPAQVYAAPLELYPGANLSRRDVKHELDRLGYRSGSSLQGAGSYATSGRAGLDVQTRPFDFWDGPQPSRDLRVTFHGDDVGSLTNEQTHHAMPIVRLDPMLIGSVYPGHGGEDRIMVKLDQVPPLLVKTLVLVEDRHFYSEIGVSFRGIARAALADLMAGRAVQGASTITQQLIRNLFLNSRRTLSRKLREALMAILLERHVSKQQILEAYLNEVYLGQDGPRAIHGFALASRFYFNKPLNELRPQEIAMLVGLVKGPSYYNPRRAPKLVLARRNLILGMMQRHGLIDQADYQRAQSAPLGVSESSDDIERYPAFVDLVKRQLQGQYDEQDLTLEGLRIFTTLDPRVQSLLEDRIVATIPKLEKAHRLAAKSLQAAGVVTSLSSGDVLAMVGGSDPRYAGYNRALDAERQVGSLAKPFDYLAAFEHPDQFSPATLLEDAPLTVPLPNGTTWSPKNDDLRFLGPVPAYEALAHSRNVPTVRMSLQVGIPAIQKIYREAGNIDDIPAVPSIFLGAMTLTPFQVAQLYTTLGSGGYFTPLQSIRAVTTSDGKTLSRYSLKIHKALPAGPTFLDEWSMTHVISEGTGRWAKSVLPAGTVLAGKTGTSQNDRDSWFAGFGSDDAAVVWVGRDDNKSARVQGADGALRIWAPLMRDLHARSLDLSPPSSVQMVLIDPPSGLRADGGCPDALQMPFIIGHAPTQYAACADAAKSSPLDWLKRIFK
jgi:penicillin-binding protein 1B